MTILLSVVAVMGMTVLVSMYVWVIGLVGLVNMVGIIVVINVLCVGDRFGGCYGGDGCGCCGDFL